MSAPYNCYDLRTCCCCGEPCYLDWSVQITGGIKNGEKFLSYVKAAVDKYAAENGIPKDEVAVFAVVEDNIGDSGGAKPITAATLPTYMTSGVASSVMERS